MHGIVFIELNIKAIKQQSSTPTSISTTRDGGWKAWADDHRMAESTRREAATGDDTNDVHVDDGDFFNDLKDDPNDDNREQGEAGRTKQNDGEDGLSLGDDLAEESFGKGDVER